MFMFFDRDIKGDRLPAKALCLTYDDGPGETEGEGPGPHTRELGRYLHAQGIRATFFVVGRHAEGRADLFRQLKAWGHLVGNHTYNHPGLAELATAGGDVVGEVARTDALIREHVAGPAVFLRPPYGNWREKQGPDGGADQPTSVVADLLNRHARFRRHVGPVNWDVSAADYDYWRRGAAAEACAAAYLEKIDRVGKGIVLMHDSSEEDAVRVHNRTLELTRLVVPVLKANGYRFVALDEVPQVQSAARVSYQAVFRTEDGQSLAWRKDGDDELVLEGVPDGGREVFGVVLLEGGRVALRAGNGLYLSAPPGGGEVRATGLAPGDRESLELEVLGEQEVALRTADRSYFTREQSGGGRVLAGGTSRPDAETFRLHRLFC
jgi:peptidoglycan/xylan/chitin deacetylase (PgdA/CDA1 family)